MPPIPPAVIPVAAGVAVAGGLAYKYRDKLGLGAKTNPATANPALPPPSTPAKPSTPANVPANAPIVPPSSSNDPTKATVTTNDPPPSGDLAVRAGPNASSPQTGGVDKDGVVDVITWNAGTTPDGYTWSYIRWGGGRNPPVTGYAHQKYLVPGS